MKLRNFLIDIDGTVCDDIPNENPELMPNANTLPGAVDTINKWFDEGHHIIFFTARTDAHKEVTEKWLKDCGFKYHSVIYNKSRGGNYVWIDNHEIKACRYTGDWQATHEEANE